MSPSKILFFFCLSFIAGVAIQSFIKIPQTFVWGILFLGVSTVSIFIFLNRNNFRILGFCILFLAVGILRMQGAEFNISENKLAKLNDGGDHIVLTGVVSEEPDIRDSTQKLKVKVSLSARAEESIVLVTTGKYPEFKYLDQIKIIGKIKTPVETEDFSYKNYLMKDGIYSVIDFPMIELLGIKKPTFTEKIYAEILWAKGRIRQSLQRSFAPPHLSIMQGMVLGDKTAISPDLKQKLSVTGVSHIIAVSGTHVVVITTILMSFLLAIGFYRGRAFYFSAGLICLYIILVGMPASGVRAGIMGITFLLGQKLGRQNNGSRIIVLTASLMLLQNPLLLSYDIGFQLSFMAVLGLIYLEPLIRYFFKIQLKKIFTKEKAEKYSLGLMMVSATLAAQVFTLPLIIYNFGNISFVSPIVNILVLPVADYIMIIGFLSSFAGIISGWLGQIISVPGYLLLSYFIFVVDFFSKPWAFQIVNNVHWIWLVISYIVISCMVWFLRKKTATF